MTEALAWMRGEIPLEVVNYDPLPPKRIKAIRKKVAKSAFEARFGTPAATVQGWEQVVANQTSPLLLKTIALDPETVEKAARTA